MRTVNIFKITREYIHNFETRRAVYIGATTTDIQKKLDTLIKGAEKWNNLDRVLPPYYEIAVVEYEEDGSLPPMSLNIELLERFDYTGQYQLDKRLDVYRKADPDSIE